MTDSRYRLTQNPQKTQAVGLLGKAGGAGADVLGGALGGGLAELTESPYLKAILPTLPRGTTSGLYNMLSRPSDITAGKAFMAGAPQLAGSLAGQLTSSLLGRKLADKPWGGTAAQIGGYGTQAATVGAVNALKTGTNLGQSMGTSLTSGLPGLGLGILTSLLSKNMSPGQQNFMGLLPSYLSPILQGVTYAGQTSPGLLTGLGLGLEGVSPFLPVIGTVISALLSEWSASKEEKAQRHQVRRSRAGFKGWAEGARPAGQELLDALMQSGKGRQEYLTGQGLSPETIKLAYGLGPGGLTSAEQRLTGPLGESSQGARAYPDLLGQFLTRAVGGTNIIDVLPYTEQVANPLGTLAKYIEEINKRTQGTITGALPSTLTTAENIWRKGPGTNLETAAGGYTPLPEAAWWAREGGYDPTLHTSVSDLLGRGQAETKAVTEKLAQVLKDPRILQTFGRQSPEVVRALEEAMALSQRKETGRPYQEDIYRQITDLTRAAQARTGEAYQTYARTGQEEYSRAALEALLGKPVIPGAYEGR